MHWLTLQKHFEHTANLFDDLHKKQEAEYIRKVVIPRMHQDADILQERGKKALCELLQTGESSKRQHWVQDLLDRDRQTNLNNILHQQITNCGFSVRTANILIASGVHTVGGLIQKSVRDILLMKNSGKKVIEEIQNFLKPHNLSLREQ